MGDHELSGGYDKKLNALKFYVMATMSLAQARTDGLGRIASHILSKLISPDLSLSQEELRRLLADLRRFLGDEVSNTEKVIRFMLWPIDLAAQLVPYRKRPRRFLSEVKKLVSPRSIARCLG